MNNNNLEFKELSKIKTPLIYKNFIKLISSISIFIILLLILTPWQQTSKGIGYITSIDPSKRIQDINAPVEGRINKWFVNDSMPVKKGDKIAEIIDNDPLIIERLSSELSAKSRKYNVAKIAGETAKIDYERQMELYKQGLVSKKDSENAKIQYKKLLSEAETAFGELKVMETKLARQETQIILAPNDGFIIKILSSNSSTIVKAGDKIATFAPTLTEMAIELYVDGNDIVLMKAGRKVRIQFEGIPAILFSGLPKMSVGTFGGVVKSVDQSISENGKFRVIVVKDGNEMFLRHGTKVYGWVLLNKVSLGYELWRKLNNFPPEFDRNLILPTK